MSSSLRSSAVVSASMLRRVRPVWVLILASGMTFATLAGLAGTIRVGR
jgi:hypothetical protein